MKTKLINDGVSDFVFEALKDDEYDPGESDFTPSSLNEPSFKRALEKSIPKDEEIEVKASWLIAPYMGTGVHKSMELYALKHPERYDAERRFYGVVETKCGKKKVGAQVDVWDKQEFKVTDGKVTKTYSIADGAKLEWIQQLNVQRWCIFKETGVLAKSLEIAGFWKDFTDHNVGRHNYPKTMQSPVPIEIWSIEKTEDWIIERIEQHLHKEFELDADPDTQNFCPPSERWARPDKFAVTKKGAKRAQKLFDTREEALNSDIYKKGGSIIDHRIGEDIRCKPQFCHACHFCWYWKSKQK